MKITLSKKDIGRFCQARYDSLAEEWASTKSKERELEILYAVNSLRDYAQKEDVPVQEKDLQKVVSMIECLDRNKEPEPVEVKEPEVVVEYATKQELADALEQMKSLFSAQYEKFAAKEKELDKKNVELKAELDAVKAELAELRGK